LIKTSLVLSRLGTGRFDIGFHSIEYHFINGAADLCSDGAFLPRFLNWRHSVTFVESEITVSSVNQDLSGACLFDAFPGGGHRFPLSRKSSARLTCLLYRPPSIGLIDVKRFRPHVLIVRAYRTGRPSARANSRANTASSALSPRCRIIWSTRASTASSRA
jgi:hypothetical protein